MRQHLLIVLFFAVLLAIPSHAYGQTTFCSDQELSGSFGRITVPEGKECVIVNATVTGRIWVKQGSTLALTGSVTVYGNITAESPVFFYIDVERPGTGPNTIYGNVSVNQATGNPGFVAVLICGSTFEGNVRISQTENSVGFGGEQPGAACSSRGGRNTVRIGNVLIEENRGGAFRVADNVVTGNLTIKQTTGPAVKRILNNQVGRNLLCEYNDPPIVVSGNTARRLFGQCAP